MNRKYYLLNNSPGQPFPDIRCYIIDDQPRHDFVLVRYSDIRQNTRTEAIVRRENLTECEDE